MITIDWGAKIINVPRNDMLLIQSSPTEIRELNLDTFRLSLKDLEDDEEGMPFPNTHNHNPVVTVSGVQLARVIEILDPYTITFEDGQYAVNLAGANSNVADKTNVNQVSVRSANSAGLVQTREIEYSSFNGMVTIDVINGVSGTAYPIGTVVLPSNNITDAKFIANLRGFKIINLLSDLTVVFGENIDELTIKSDNWFILTVESGASCINTIFEKLSLYGVMSDYWNIIIDCWVYTITNFCGWIRGGSFEYVEIGVGDPGAEFGSMSYFDSILPMYPGVAGILVMNSDITVSFTDAYDIYEIRSMVAGTTLNFGLAEGTLVLDSSCTGGDVSVFGIGILINNSTANVNSDGLMSKETITKITWNSVFIDTINGVSGTAFPKGTSGTPCDNFMDALTIANQNNINEIFFVGELTLLSGLSNFCIHGSTSLDSCILNLNNQLLENVFIEGCTVRGILNAVSIEGEGWARKKALVNFENCYLEELENLEGTAIHCQIEGDTKIKSEGWFSGIEIVIEGDFTVFDLQNSTSGVSMDINSGWAQFINAGVGSLIELNVKGGEVSLDSSCVGGEYYLEGIGTLFNDSAMVVKENHLPLDEPLEYHLIPGSFGNGINTLLDVEQGNWEIISNQMIFYDRNDDELMRFDLLDSSGDPSMTNIFKREKVI